MHHGKCPLPWPHRFPTTIPVCPGWMRPRRHRARRRAGNQKVRRPWSWEEGARSGRIGAWTHVLDRAGQGPVAADADACQLLGNTTNNTQPLPSGRKSTGRLSRTNTHNTRDKDGKAPSQSTSSEASVGLDPLSKVRPPTTPFDRSGASPQRIVHMLRLLYSKSTFERTATTSSPPRLRSGSETLGDLTAPASRTVRASP